MLEVAPDLLLGTAAQLRAEPERPDDVIINCTRHVEYLRLCGNILRLSADDIGLYLDLSSDVIRRALSAGHRVLVHDGKEASGRAAAVVASYLVRCGRGA